MPWIRDTGGTLRTNFYAGWNFEGNSKDVVDGSTKNGTDTAISYGTSFGKIKQGASFDGSTSSSSVPSVTVAAGSFSISCWFKHLDSTNDYIVLKRTVAGNPWEFTLLIVSDGTVQFDQGTGANGMATSSTTANDGNWHNLVVVRNKGGTNFMYMDAVQVATAADDNVDYSNAANMVFGRDLGSPSNTQLLGYLDMFYIWTKGLTTTEVTDLYNSGNGNAYTTTNLYITNVANTFTPSILGSWTITTSAITRMLGNAPLEVAATCGQAEAVSTVQEVLLGRWISEPLSAAVTFTASDTMSWIIGVLESSGNANDLFHIHAFVTVGSADTLRGTILTNNIGATEWPTTNAAGATEGVKTLSAVSASIGDRIIIEIGYEANNTSSTSFTGTMNYGNTGADLTAGSTSVTTLAGNITFQTSDYILFNSPNVNDSVTVSESVTMTMSAGSPTTSVSDSVTISESVTILLPTLTLSVSDDVTVIETVSLSVKDFISVSDTATIVDLPDTVLVNNIGVDDLISISEFVSLIIIDDVSVNDAIAVSENVAIFFPVLPLDVNDLIDVSEFVLLTIIDFVNTDDLITVFENVSILIPTYIIDISDTISVNEFIGLEEVFFTNVDDLINISEFVSLSETGGVGTSISVSDFINVNDVLPNSPPLDVSYLPIVNDVITVLDIPTIEITSFVNTSDFVSISEFILLNIIDLIFVDDAITISESVSLLELDFVNTDDSITVIEFGTVFLPVLTLSVDDSIAISESVSMSLVCFIDSNDDVSISESINILLTTHNVFVFDSVATNEFISILDIVNVSLNDGIIISENISILENSLVLNVFDVVSIVENISISMSSSILSLFVFEIIGGGVVPRIIFLDGSPIYLIPNSKIAIRL